MKYLGSITDPKDLVNKEYVDAIQYPTVVLTGSVDDIGSGFMGQDSITNSQLQAEGITNIDDWDIISLVNWAWSSSGSSDAAPRVFPGRVEDGLIYPSCSWKASENKLLVNLYNWLNSTATIAYRIVLMKVR